MAAVEAVATQGRSWFQTLLQWARTPNDGQNDAQWQLQQQPPQQQAGSGRRGGTGQAKPKGRAKGKGAVPAAAAGLSRERGGRG